MTDPKLHSIRQAFGEILVKLAKDNPNLYVVDVDLASSLSLTKFASRFRNRFIECGVAESNAAAIAAGLAKSGKTVFLTSYACFSPSINWNVIKQSICYNHANVKIIGSHAGLMTSAYGATHQMLEDVALMRSLPNMEVFAPADDLETKKIITAVAHSHRPAYVRLVRPSTSRVTTAKTPFTIGRSTILQTGSDVTVLGYGPILTPIFDIRKPSLEIINCSSVKPFDSVTLLKSVSKTKRLLVIEDHQKNGGVGELAATAILTDGRFHPKFIHLAVDNKFGQSARQYQQLYDHYGLGFANIISALKKLMSR